MKTRLLLFLTLIASVIQTDATARCAGRGISIFPESGTPLPQNPVFVIGLYGESASLATGIGKSYAVTLKRKGETIPCNAVEILAGTFRSTQVLVKPSRLLTPGAQYSLSISVPSTHAAGELTAHSYRVNGDADTSVPAFSSLPEYTGSNYTAFGCGPAITVDYRIKSNASGAPWIHASLTDRDGTTTSFLLPVDNAGAFSLGHGMCSGSFELTPGRTYQAVLRLMDNAGNKSSETAEISFTAPAPKHTAE